MTPRSSRTWLVAGFLAALILPFGLDAKAAPESTNLSDLPPAAQAQISAAIGRDHSGYHAVARGGGFRAANPRHSLVADFARSGIKVSAGTATWSLALRGYGYADALQPVKPVAPQAMANRVEYQRGALTEWYLNGPLGLEQGFTIARPPAGETAEPLTLALTFSGHLTASVTAGGNDVVLSRADGTPVLAYRGLTAYDATGRELRAWVQISGNELRLRVDATGAQYPVVVDPFVQQAKLTASAGADVTGLGVSVAVSGDTIVVGATSDFSISQGGSAHVFVRPAGGWSGAPTESAKLTVSGGTSTDGFGESVTISGNVIVVGAPGAAPDLQGAAYVFVKPAGGWTGTLTPSAKLTASDAAPQGVFGNLVAASDDTIVVAPDANAGQRTVYVFVKPVGDWTGSLTENAKLTVSGTPVVDFFGGSLGVSGDTVVVGAPFPPSTQDSPGSAYVFVRPAGGWTGTLTESATLMASDGVDGDRFGFQVAVGADTIAAIKEESTVTYAFVKPAGGWSSDPSKPLTENASLTASDGAIFGSVAVRGDIIVAGAPIGALGIPSLQGSAYVFVRPPGGWSGMSETERLLASDGAENDLLGTSIAMSGDTIVVGAPGNNNNRGAAYVFINPAQNPAPIANAGPDQTADEGAPVALDGSASSGTALTFAWRQLLGPEAALDNPSSPTPSFTAPPLPGGFGSQTLTFELTVTSADGSSTDTVDVTVRNVNHAPVADAGGDQGVNEGSPVTLSGALSFDPDGDPLTFSWIQTSGTPVVLSGADTESPTFIAPVLPGSAGAVAILSFSLTVSDGALSNTAETRVTVEQVNHPPVADDGSPQTVAAGALVALDASASFDPDGDPLTFSWTQTGGPGVMLSNPNTATPSFVAPADATTLSFRVSVSDGRLTTDSAGVAVTVTTANDPPLCHLARAWPPILWPPIHRMIPVKIVGVADPDHDRVVIKVISVTQDEPVNGVAHGDTSPDAVIQSKWVLVRAERADKGNGRVYEIKFTADDGHGGSCAGSVKVKVPRFWMHPIDDGQLYDSTQP